MSTSLQGQLSRFSNIQFTKDMLAYMTSNKVHHEIDASTYTIVTFLAIRADLTRYASSPRLHLAIKKTVTGTTNIASFSRPVSGMDHSILLCTQCNMRINSQSGSHAVRQWNNEPLKLKAMRSYDLHLILHNKTIVPKTKEMVFQTK